MKVLVAHVRYREFGGEDVVVATEARILREAGHEVHLLNPLSSDFDGLSLGQRAAIGLSGGFHSYGRRMVRECIEASRPDVVHFHNLYPLLGTGAMVEASRLGVAVVQTLHNYRPSCIAGTHLLRGQPCEYCSVTSHAKGVMNRCYRSSISQSTAMTLAVRRQVSALGSVPDILIALTGFAAARLVEHGIDPQLVEVKPNSVDLGCGGDYDTRSGVAYVGRLSPEKGVLALTESWPGNAPMLTITGRGPQEKLLASIADDRQNVRFLGGVSPDEAREVIRGARVLALPSVWFEGMPLVVLEALSERTPPLFLSEGMRPEVLDEKIPACDNLEALIREACVLHDSKRRWQDRAATSFELFNTKYTHEVNVRNLEAVYLRAVQRRTRISLE